MSMKRKVERVVVLLLVFILLFNSSKALAADSTSNDIEGLGIRCSINDSQINASSFNTSSSYVNVKIHDAKYRYVGSGDKCKTAKVISGNLYISYDIKKVGSNATRWYSCKATASLSNSSKTVTTRTIYN